VRNYHLKAGRKSFTRWPGIATLAGTNKHTNKQQRWKTERLGGGDDKEKGSWKEEKEDECEGRRMRLKNGLGGVTDCRAEECFFAWGGCRREAKTAKGSSEEGQSERQAH
jgi:hypothetical protein